MSSSIVRENIVNTIKLDLIGPHLNSEKKYLEEVVSTPPSMFYLTGFLVPKDRRITVEIEDDGAENAPDELDEASDTGGNETNSLLRKYPSSMGLSFLVSKNTSEVEVDCSWGEYKEVLIDGNVCWKRSMFSKSINVKLGETPSLNFTVVEGVELTVNQKTLNLAGDSYGLIENGTKSVSIFLVNRKSIPTDRTVFDPFFLFQATMEVKNKEGFCPRPNLRALDSEDVDDRIADLQFSNMHEYATGHGVAALFENNGAECRTISTSWIPSHEVERVVVPEIKELVLKMSVLAKLTSPAEARKLVVPLEHEYQKWIDEQVKLIPKDIKRREETGVELVSKFKQALKRIKKGIEALEDQKVFTAFKLANEAMAIAAEKRGLKDPEWRPFQLAFLLMNITGIVDPTHADRETVDLLYFPTGGGKTEAYLGVASFTLLYRRLVDPTIHSAGVSILMRYTLRLLTLDQLERATTLICALELIRVKRGDLGEWPYEIGLWVGQAATPNRMGFEGDKNPWSARTMLRHYQNDKGKSPVPLEKCPWCATPLHQKDSFKLTPDQKKPNNLEIICASRSCDFSATSKAGRLPLVVVDEVIYRRLPCFIISTVDKLASMPWEEKIGKLFGKVNSSNKEGFYSKTESVGGTTKLKSELKQIDLIIQDELHLISGPLGTMVGLYETAVDELASRVIDGKKIRTKVIASTATVRHAQKQVRALFARNHVDIFPVPGITSKDSFFAKVTPASIETPGRLYVGIAAQGRSTKNLLMRSYITSMSAAQKQLDSTNDKKLVDPYLTALGYFNSLRELGGARRIIEDEVNSKLRIQNNLRKRVGEKDSETMGDRSIKFEVLELTSRVDTADVAAAKHKLSIPYGNSEFVDVAIATNMISVGLDITRLGLMLVFGQPKTTAEYIQASSRVGRGQTPGLVITLYNIHRHRDRSLYEKFVPYHQSYYRDVETTSVTPFSTKALDKGLAGTFLSLVRHMVEGMSREEDAKLIASKKNEIKEKVCSLIINRLKDASYNIPPTVEKSLNERLSSFLDDWERASIYTNSEKQEELTYTKNDNSLIHPYLDPRLSNLPGYFKKFRANRSMREVEPSVNIWVSGITDKDSEG
jgi:hypothetical protein